SYWARATPKRKSNWLAMRWTRTRNCSIVSGARASTRRRLWIVRLRIAANRAIRVWRQAQGHAFAQTGSLDVPSICTICSPPLGCRARHRIAQPIFSTPEEATMHDDLLSLLGKTDFSRRQFVVTSLATGFALAVQPVSAETITTDTSGLEAGEVKIPT